MKRSSRCIHWWPASLPLGPEYWSSSVAGRTLSALPLSLSLQALKKRSERLCSGQISTTQREGSILSRLCARMRAFRETLFWKDFNDQRSRVCPFSPVCQSGQVMGPNCQSQSTGYGPQFSEKGVVVGSNL
jgi:hypothetical protein